jgi:hypothetical protein
LSCLLFGDLGSFVLFVIFLKVFITFIFISKCGHWLLVLAKS